LYLGYRISYCQNEGINIKPNPFWRKCGKIRTKHTTKILKVINIKPNTFRRKCEKTTKHATKILQSDGSCYVELQLQKLDNVKIKSAEMKFLRSVAGFTLQILREIRKYGTI
jgi:hypothetical protein